MSKQSFEKSVEQLEQIIQPPLVTRYYDDLATTPPADDTPDQAKSDCDVAGALELKIHPPTISWELYNKKQAPKGLRVITPSRCR